MREQQIRLDGIYNSQVLKHAQALGIKNLGFDFRTRSFNFLQQHIFLEFLPSLISTNTQLFLTYANEAEIIVKKMRDDLKSFLGSEYNSLVCFDFCGDESAIFVNSLNTPFICKYQNDRRTYELMNSSKLKGLSFDLSYLLGLEDAGKLEYFAKQFYLREDFYYILNVDCHSNDLSKYLLMIPFNIISTSIDQTIEFSYRNVDLSSLTQRLTNIKNLAHIKNLSESRMII